MNSPRRPIPACRCVEGRRYRCHHGSAPADLVAGAVDRLRSIYGNIIEIVSPDLGQHLAVLVDLEIVAKHHAELRVGRPRRELLDQVFFWNTVDLERKLRCFQLYFNHSQTHASLEGNTPAEMSGNVVMHPAALRHFTWEKHCGGHFELPIAA